MVPALAQSLLRGWWPIATRWTVFKRQNDVLMDQGFVLYTHGMSHLALQLLKSMYYILEPWSEISFSLDHAYDQLMLKIELEFNSPISKLVFSWCSQDHTSPVWCKPQNDEEAIGLYSTPSQALKFIQAVEASYSLCGAIKTLAFLSHWNFTKFGNLLP